MIKNMSQKQNGLRFLLVILIFVTLIASAAQTTLGEGPGGGGGGSGGEGGGSGGEGGGSGGEGGDSGGEGGGSGGEGGDSGGEGGGSGGEGGDSGGEGGGSGDSGGGSSDGEGGGSGGENGGPGGEGPNGGGNQTQQENKEQNGDGSGNQSGESSPKQQQSGGGGGSGDGNKNKDGGGESNAWRHMYRNEFNQSIENGSLVLEATFQMRNGQMVQENNHYHLGMEMELDEATKNRIRVRVRAEFNEGKLIVLNVGHNVLNFGEPGKGNLYFDGNQMQQGNLVEVLNENGPQAKYTAVHGEGGSQFLVYIPHFSEHTIEIESLIDHVQDELFSGTNLVVAGISILTLIGLSFHIYKIGKGRE